MPGQNALAQLDTRRAYPLTSEAFEALSREVAELDAALRQEGGPGVLGGDGDRDGLPLEFPRLTAAARARRLEALRALLAEGEIVRARNVAAIGRRVTVLEPDGARERYALVAPGDGDPFNGWVSADSPIGRALVWATPGDRVVVQAPSGRRTIEVLAVETPRDAEILAPRPDARRPE